MSSTTVTSAVSEDKRTQGHDFKLNVEQQVQRKVQHAAKALMKVESNDETVKIKPNSGNFKVLSQEFVNIKVGDEIKSPEGVAVVKDQHQQTDIRGIPYMVKTEFLVTDVATGSNQKAVIHTYLTQTYFMIQGNEVMQNGINCKDFFYESILKQFLTTIMEKKGKEIHFINQLLKAQTKTTKTLVPSQWKRKQSAKGDKCDICSRTFTNSQGVNLHKKRVHGSGLMQLRRQRLDTELTRSDSVHEYSRPSSPSPKKFIIEVQRQNKEEIEEKEKENENKGIVVGGDDMEESGNNKERISDQKVDISIQCTFEDLVFPQNVRAGLMTKLEDNLKLAKLEIDELIKEKKQLKAHNARKHAGYENEYEEVLMEKQRMSNEIVKLQTERDILLAKVTTLEQKAEDNEVVD